MELKLAKAMEDINIYESSNRTFMELKHIMLGDTIVTASVLIVPLWN